MLSKRGLCSRTQAAAWIRDGRVQVDGRVIRDPEFPTVAGRHRVAVDGGSIDAQAPEVVYVMLNKPRGLVTTAHDEHGRETVYRCFEGSTLGFIAPVGRLDKASEGLLLFSNDPEWSARVLDPSVGPDKTYHVQVDPIPDAAMLSALRTGIVQEGEFLRAKSVALLRTGTRHAWLEVVLDEGRNRHIRRLLAALHIDVLRLVRVAIGPLQLGDLPKGEWRALSAEEAAALGG